MKTFLMTIAIIVSFFAALTIAKDIYQAWQPPQTELDKIMQLNDTKTIKCMRKAMKKAGYHKPLLDEAWIIFYPQCKPWL